MTRFAALCGFLIVTAALTGCATTDTRTAEERVADRALERWQAQIDKDWDKAYTYLSPGYRETNSVQRYRANHGGSATWSDPELKSIDCPEVDVCDVQVVASYEVRIPRIGNHQGRRPMQERWILVDEEWWLFPRR